MRLIVSRNQRTTEEGMLFRLAFRLVVDADEAAVMRLHHLLPLTLGQVDGVWEGRTIEDAIAHDVYFDTPFIHHARQVEAQLKQDCEELAMELARLPALAAEFTGQAEYEYRPWQVERTPDGIQMLPPSPDQGEQ